MKKRQKSKYQIIKSRLVGGVLKSYQNYFYIIICVMKYLRKRIVFKSI